MILWRPVGINELSLMFDASMRSFPPRLPEQPIFYPVLNFAYAEQIARDWNAQEPEGAGYVTQFSVNDDYLRNFSRQIVGGRQHEEFWIPAEQLSEFNRRIDASIKITSAFFGDNFRGHIPDQFGLRGKTATDQFTCLAESMDYSIFDVSSEIAANAKSVFLNFPFWTRGCVSKGRALTDKERRFVSFVRKRWSQLNLGFNLPAS